MLTVVCPFATLLPKILTYSVVSVETLESMIPGAPSDIIYSPYNKGPCCIVPQLHLINTYTRDYMRGCQGGLQQGVANCRVRSHCVLTRLVRIRVD